MSVITNGLYKVVLHQLYASQLIQNVFFYEHTLASDDEQEDCAEAFDDDVLLNLKAIQGTTLTYTTIRVANVTGDLADFVRNPTTTAGVQAGAPMNSFTACSFKLNRTTKETRNGHKRFAAMTEENAFNQNWISAFQTSLETFAPFLGAQISVVGALFNPVIARQSLIDPSEWTVNPVASVTASLQVASQVSRKSPRT